jgi:hypothetical protein|tara:strand:+ start:4896 stop:5489 length:594 start_codon:yes stop_codon:yes gene_type:complete
MSSTSAPFGFRPSYHNSGRITAKAYVIATGYAQNIFQGDPVKLTDDGVIQLGTSDGTRSGTVDGINLLGIFAGVQYDDSTGKPSLSPFWPASTAATNIVAFVYDDPEIIFDVQYDNPASGTTVQTAVGEECDWSVASPGGSTSVGLSETKLTAIQATSGQFQITGIAGGVDNALTDAYVEVTVRINEHQYKAAVNSV